MSPKFYVIIPKELSMNFKISIIVAIYNTEKYLEQCLNSLVNQTLMDVEIVLVNDGSTDRCAEIINAYQQKYSKIKVITQENAGPGSARNRALDIAAGEYVLFVDSDDWIALDACEVLYNKAKKINADIVLTGDADYVEETGLVKDKGFYSFSRWKDCNSINEKQFIPTLVPGCFRLYRTSFLNKYHLRFNEHLFYEDSSFGCLVNMLAKRIGFVKNLYYYRLRKESTTGTVDYKVFDLVKDFEYFCNFVRVNNIKSKNIKYAYIWYLNSFLIYYKALLPNYQKMLFIKLVMVLPLFEITDKDIYFSKALSLIDKQKLVLFFNYIKTKEYSPRISGKYLFEILLVKIIRSNHDT